MNKVVITGHTSGLGQALYEKFSDANYDVIGYSTSTGHDISSKEIQDTIVENLQSGVFINNAYHPTAQLELLTAVTDKWKGTNNVIINVSSKMVYFPLNPEPFGFTEYMEAKKLLNAFITERLTVAHPKIINVVVGVSDTRMSANLKCDKLTPKEFAEFVFYLYSIRDTVAVQEAIIDVPGLDWKDIKFTYE